MVQSLFLIFAIIIMNASGASVQNATVINSTGEYYITNNQQFRGEIINCSASQSNTSACYIVCENVYSCQNLDLFCSSNICNIQCMDSSCLDMNISSDSDEINVYCDEYGCNYMNIIASTNSKLNLDCDGTQSCEYTSLTVPNLTGHTNITCDGSENSNSCSYMLIKVPYPYQQEFLSFNYINVNNDSAQSKSAVNVTIICLDTEDCTEYTHQAIISTAEPSMIDNKTGVIYYNGTNVYQYRFQQIICNESQTCHINCVEELSCTKSFIECKSGSECVIDCGLDDSCQYAAIKSDGKKADVTCEFYHANDNSDTWQEGCWFLNITSSSDITFTCKGTGNYVYDGWNHPGGCWGTFVHCNKGTPNSCTIDCTEAEGISCSPYIWIPDEFVNGFLNLVGAYDDPSTADYFLTYLECTEGHNQITGHNQLGLYSPCMPWNPTNGDIIRCNDPDNCHIECLDSTVSDNPYFTQKGCSYQAIRGGMVKNLTVTCDRGNDYLNDVCDGLVVWCYNGTSTDDNESCKITYDYGKNGGYVHARNTSNVAITLTSTDSEVESVTIDVADARNFEINGEGQFDYSTIYANHTQNVDIGGGIKYFGMDVYAMHAENVQIGSLTAFNELMLDVENVNKLDLFCNDLWSCYNLELYGQNANELNIHASGDDGGSMLKAKIHISNNTNLYCENYGCENITFITLNGLNDINVTWDGTCACDDINDCINQWNIICDNGTKSSSFDGSCVNNYCCSDDDANEIKDEFDDYWSLVDCKIDNSPSKKTVLIIVIASVVVAILVIVGLLWYCKKRKVRKQTDQIAYQNINNAAK